MRKRILLAGLLFAALLTTTGSATAGGTSTASPRFMNDANHQLVSLGVQPPPFCCLPAPEGITGKLPTPTPVNMSYFGGPVQVQPKIYVVFWGWGEPGAFDHTTSGLPASDPDGAGARMLAFVKAIGGTYWAGTQTQYYQQVNGFQQHIDNPANQFGGVWYDNTNPIHDNLSWTELAQEAARAVTHFGVTDLHNSQFIIAQPQKYNDQGFNSGQGYCAWHDFTNGVNFPGVRTGISFTNMPYVLNAGTGCGQNSVNPNFYSGRLDGFTIVLGHEIEETVTDPGAGEKFNGTDMSGWYDDTGFENGDKCAWVGYTGANDPSQVPGGLQNITGNDGKLYPVQLLWSNDANAGTGYCAGGNNDLPNT